MVKEYLTLFIQNFGIAIIVTMHTDAIIRMNRTVFLLSRQCCGLNQEQEREQEINNKSTFTNYNKEMQMV